MPTPQIVAVTGASGGIGRATGRAFAGCGATVVLMASGTTAAAAGLASAATACR